MTPNNAIRDCPVCRLSLKEPASENLVGSGEHQTFGYEFACRHCGNFSIDQSEYGGLLKELDSPANIGGANASPLKMDRHRAVLAHALQRMRVSGQKPVLKHGLAFRILKEDRLPSLAEQRDNVLRWFREHVEMGSDCGISWDFLGAYVGAESQGAFLLLLESLSAQGLVAGNIGSDASAQMRLTYRGLERLEQLERAAPSGFNAFMAMKFGDTDLDKVVDSHFRPAVNATGFQLLRLDDRPEAGLIDARLRNEIRNCRFLIADLSHSNAGSYWEAGYAEGLGKPVIYTCEKSVFDGKGEFERPHFDTNHHLTIKWQANDPKQAAEKLKETIRFTIPEAQQTN